MPDQNWTSDSILQISRTFWACRILLTSAELEVFSLLEKENRSAKQAAKHMACDLRATTYLLDALCAMGLLEKHGDTYSIEPSAIPFLSNESEECVLPMLLHEVALWHRWDKLTEVARTGKPANVEIDQGQSEINFEAFIQAMHVIGRSQVDDNVATLDVTGARNLLDVGGATGTYTMALLRRQPEMHATIFDRPGVMPLARKRLAEEGFIDRVRLCGGDLYTDELPGGYDLALVSAIIHMNSRSQNRDLYKKVYSALLPGGRIVIRDHVMDDSHTMPPAGALFAINMLVCTEGGGCFSFNEIKEDLESVGFRDVVLLQEDERMNGLVAASR